jgi:hypothetical protein
MSCDASTALLSLMTVARSALKKFLIVPGKQFRASSSRIELISIQENHNAKLQHTFRQARSKLRSSATVFLVRQDSTLNRNR